MDAKTGKTVALVSAERTLLQKWKSGILPASMAEIAFDESSGVWTRMELTTTLLPPGQTATVTKFVLPGTTWRQVSLKEARDAWAVARSKVVVFSVGPDDLCELSSDGTLLAVRRAATHQVDVLSLGGC